MDDHKAMLEQVFGQSSDSEVEDSMQGDDRSPPLSVRNPTCRPIHQINGLWFCVDFLSPGQQSFLLSAIQNGLFPLFSFAPHHFEISSGFQFHKSSDV